MVFIFDDSDKHEVRFVLNRFFSCHLLRWALNVNRCRLLPSSWLPLLVEIEVIKLVVWTQMDSESLATIVGHKRSDDTNEVKVIVIWYSWPTVEPIVVQEKRSLPIDFASKESKLLTLLSLHFLYISLCVVFRIYIVSVCLKVSRET